MKAKFVRDALLEFQRIQDPDYVQSHAKEVLNVGNFHERTKAYVKLWAEKNGFGYGVTKKGNIRLLTHYKIPGLNMSKSFSITFPPDWKDSETPISLRNHEGQLMDRFPNAMAVTKRITDNLAREVKAATKRETPEGQLLKNIRDGKVDKVKTLLKQGVSPNHKVATRIDKNIPLFQAVQGGNFEMVKTLVDAGVKINQTAGKHKRHIITNLLFDTRFDRKKNGEIFKIIKLLYDNGADPSDDPSLMSAVTDIPSPEILEYMMDKVEIPHEDLVHMLNSAVWMGQYELMKFLLELGIDPYDTRGKYHDRSAMETWDNRLEGNNYMLSHEPHDGYYEYQKVYKELEKYRK